MSPRPDDEAAMAAQVQRAEREGLGVEFARKLVSVDPVPVAAPPSPPTIDYTVDEEMIQFHLGLEHCEPDLLIAHLLINSVIFLNTHWDEKTWPEAARDGIVMLINVNDTFGPYADCERITYDEIERFYRMWRKDPLYAAVAWVMAKRKVRPWQRKAPDERLVALGYDVEALLRGELP